MKEEEFLDDFEEDTPEARKDRELKSVLNNKDFDKHMLDMVMNEEIE